MTTRKSFLAALGAAITAPAAIAGSLRNAGDTISQAELKAVIAAYTEAERRAAAIGRRVLAGAKLQSGQFGVMVDRLEAEDWPDLDAETINDNGVGLVGVDIDAADWTRRKEAELRCDRFVYSY